MQTSKITMMRGKQLKGNPQPVYETEADTDSDDSVSSGFVTRTNLEESHVNTHVSEAHKTRKFVTF